MVKIILAFMVGIFLFDVIAGTAMTDYTFYGWMGYHLNWFLNFFISLFVGWNIGIPAWIITLIVHPHS